MRICIESQVMEDRKIDILIIRRDSSIYRAIQQRRLQQKSNGLNPIATSVFLWTDLKLY